ncbi:hypothetical protein P9112_000509 [Eukaryota sp. TZLM1-RC]
MDLDPFLRWAATLDEPCPPSTSNEVILQFIGEYLDHHGFHDVKLLLERRANCTFADHTSARLQLLLTGALHTSAIIKNKPNLLTNTSFQTTSTELLSESEESDSNVLFCLPGQDINSVIQSARQPNTSTNLSTSTTYDIFDCTLSSFLIASTLPALLRRGISDLGLLYSDPEFSFASSNSTVSLPFTIIRTLPPKYHELCLRNVLGVRALEDPSATSLPSPLPSFSSPCCCSPLWWPSSACRFLSTWIKLRPLSFSSKMILYVTNSLSQRHCPHLSSALNQISFSPLPSWLRGLTSPCPLLTNELTKQEVTARFGSLFDGNVEVLGPCINAIDTVLFSKFDSSSLLPSWEIDFNVEMRSIKSSSMAFWFNVLGNFSSCLVKVGKYYELLVNLAYYLYTRGDIFGSMAIFSPIPDPSQLKNQSKSIDCNPVTIDNYSLLKNLFSKEGGYARLKAFETDQLSKRVAFIPYVGMYSALIVSIDEMNTNLINDLINVDKLRIFDSIVSKIDSLKSNILVSDSDFELSNREKTIASQLSCLYVALKK